MTSDEFQDRRALDVKFTGGLAWTAGAKWTTQALTWASVLAVARLLSKEDYGIGDMAGMFVNITNVLAEFGIGTAVLHMPGLDRKTLGQLHMFSMLLCTGFFGISVLLAPAVAWFFHSDHVLFFAVTASGFLLTGVQAVPLGMLQRDMDYRRLALMDALGSTAGSVMTIVGALLGWGYWALFAGAASGKVCATAVLCYWKPVHFAWPRWNDIRKPVEMGRHVAVSRAAASAYGMADGIVIARTMGAGAVGTYRMAMNLASAPADKIAALIMRTATPLFANVMNDLPLARRYYLIIGEFLSLSIIPLMLGLAIVAPQAVLLLLTKQYSAAAGPLRWLGLFMILRVLGTLAEQVLVSQKLTRLTMRMAILNFVVMPLSFIVAARWKGATGVAAAWIVLSPVTVFPLLWILMRSIKLPLREYAMSLIPALSGSALMCLAVLALRTRLPAEWPLAIRLGAQVAAGGAVYIGFILCFFRQRIQRYVNFVSSLRKPKPAPEPAIS
ncbi:MAG TPA: lipopolysaccharide biosynthesis protein [Bryobacteraceae bacterium]|jgi:PST family polysaccharide transporter